MTLAPARPPRRPRRFLQRVLLTFVSLLIAGAAWQWWADTLDRRAHPPLGTFVQVDGHRMRLRASGLEHAGPLVILECGIGGSTSATWAWEQAAVERFARVVSYDRSGLGASDPGELPRDGVRIAAELQAALAAAGLRGPYVFVGHSYGGLIARLFTAHDSADVAGLVLVESSHPHQFGRRGRSPGIVRTMSAIAPLAPWFARVGGMRAFFALVRTSCDDLPPAARDEQKHFLASPAHWNGVVRELASWEPLTSDEAARVESFGDRPLVVLTAGESARTWGAWGELQRDMARLSTRGVQRVVEGASHASLVERQPYADSVVAAIRTVVDAVKSAPGADGSAPSR